MIRRLFQMMFTLDGRLSRRSFWFYHLAGILIALPAVVIAYAVGNHYGDSPPPQWFPIPIIATAPLFLLWLAGSIAVAVKRLHDLDRSGFYYLFALIPYVGALWFLIYGGFFPGTPHRNRFGNPSRQ